MTRSESSPQALRIGVCGHLWLNAEQRLRVHNAALAALTGHCQRQGEPRRVALYSGLAPGADLVLTAAIMECLQARRTECELHVRMIADAEHLIEHWLRRGEELGHGPTDQARQAVRERMSYWLGRARSVSVISLPASGLCSPFQALAAQLAQDPQLLFAVQRPDHPGGPGGTAEILKWRQQPELIPDELRNGQYPRFVQQSIIINPDSGVVTSVGEPG